jgi:thioredoxin 1
MSDVVEVTDQTFQAEVLESELPVVVDFWAEWCAPCRMVAPILKKLAAEMKGKVKIAKLDVDSNRSTAGQFGIQGIPTLIFFRGGRPVDQRIGLSSEADLRAAVERLGSSS